MLTSFRLRYSQGWPEAEAEIWWQEAEVLFAVVEEAMEGAASAAVAVVAAKQYELVK